MKKKLTTLLTLLVLCVTGAWADNYYILSAKSHVPLTAGTCDVTQLLKSNGTSVVATTAISSDQTTAGSAFYYNSTSASYANLTNTENYGASGDNTTMSPIKINTGNTMTITLNSKTFTKMDVLYACKSKDAKSITIDGTVYNTNDQNVHIASKTKDFATSIAISNSSGKEYNVIVILTEPTYDISFALPDGATGIAPATINDGAGEAITLPKNFTMYKANSTFKGWDADNDGDVDYAGGAEYTVTGAATLKAVFEDNGGTTLDDRTLATTITFDFQRKNGAPTVTWQAPTLPTSGVWMAQANVAGKTIDVKMDWDVTTSGAKINNSSWNDWAQLNNGTQFVIPSAAGATVDIEAYNDTDDETKVNGSGRTSVSGNTSHYEISSAAETATIVMSGKGSYYRTIKVTLPGPTYDVDFTLSNVTKTTGDATVEGGTEYTATFAAADGYVLPASVEVTAGGALDITANCTWTKATGTLTIPADYTTDDIAITINGVAIAGSEIIKSVPSSATSSVVTGTIGGTHSAGGNFQNRDDENGGCKLGKDGTYVGITLKAGYTFQTGDIISVNIGTGANGNFAFFKDYSGSEEILITSEQASTGLHSFVLPEAVNGETTIYIVRRTGSNLNPYIDYISVTRPVSVTVGKNGYTTFACTYPLDLTDAKRPAGLKAYKATLDGANLTFTALNQTVPAGTGLLLLGENDGTYNILPAASGDAVTTALVGVTTPTAKQSVENDTYYFVMKKATSASDELTFAPLSTIEAVTIPAGKAYVEVPNTAFVGARELSISFDDGETTGLADVRGKMADVRGDYYNLNGQRVAQPTKGLYIVNGRKVVIK